MYEIQIKEVCNGIWNCLESTDWIQLISVFIAMLAAIAAYATVVQQKRQFQAANEERKKRFRPIFKINYFNKTPTPKKYIFDIVNEGFGYFIPKEVNWVGDGNIKVDYFTGEVGNDKRGMHESFVLTLDIADTQNARGYFEINIKDIDNNPIKYKSPDIIFNNGEIANDINLSKRYLE